MAQQPKDPPPQGAPPDHNPTGTTPNGIPDQDPSTEATGHPTSDREQTEKAAGG